MIICIHAIKIADSVLQNDEGEYIITHADTFYSKGMRGFWMMKMVGGNWKILKVLVELEG